MSDPIITVTVERNAAGRNDYIVTTSSGYRAVIEQCDRDECREGSLKECRTLLDDREQHKVGSSTSVVAWLKHTAKHCHGWHDGRIDAFVDSLRKTYGRKLPRAITLLKARPQRGPMTDDQVAEELGITVDEYRAELAKAAS